MTTENNSKWRRWMSVGIVALMVAGCSKGRSNPYKDVTAISVTNGDMLVVETVSNGTAVINFTEMTCEKVSYQWRFKACGSDKEESGGGSTVEKPIILAQLEKSRFEIVSGGKKYVEAGTLRIWWAPCTTDEAWLYYHPDRTKVLILPNKDFRTYKL